MLTSESYIELVNRGYSQARQDGSRAYPVACYEIFMLNRAQQRATQREIALFQQLTEIFDWDMSRRQRSSYQKKLQAGFTFVLTDLSKTILWTSQSFLSMTGYAHNEAVGRSPKMLQGPDTDLREVSRVRASLESADPVKVNLLNYRKGGEPYTCRIAIDPLYNSQGELTHFLAVESEVN